MAPAPGRRAAATSRCPSRPARRASTDRFETAAVRRPSGSAGHGRGWPDLRGSPRERDDPRRQGHCGRDQGRPHRPGRPAARAGRGPRARHRPGRRRPGQPLLRRRQAPRLRAGRHRLDPARAARRRDAGRRRGAWSTSSTPTRRAPATSSSCRCPPGSTPARRWTRMDPAKDADGLHPTNLGRLVLGERGAAAVHAARHRASCCGATASQLAGADVTVVGRGVTVGRPLGLLLTRRSENATVTLVPHRHAGPRRPPAAGRHRGRRGRGAGPGHRRHGQAGRHGARRGHHPHRRPAWSATSRRRCARWPACLAPDAGRRRPDDPGDAADQRGRERRALAGGPGGPGRRREHREPAARRPERERPPIRGGWVGCGMAVAVRLGLGVVGLCAVALDHFRSGCLLLGVAVLLAALARLVLPYAGSGCSWCAAGPSTCRARLHGLGLAVLALVPSPTDLTFPPAPAGAGRAGIASRAKSLDDERSVISRASTAAADARSAVHGPHARQRHRHRRGRPDRLRAAVPHRLRPAARPGHPVRLRLLEITPALKAAEGTAMELDDCAFPLLAGIDITDDPRAAFDGVNVALLVGARPRTAGMERGDLLEANGGIFKPQGEAINAGAADDVRVLVVGNPANTNALIAAHARARRPGRPVHRDDAPRPQPRAVAAGQEDRRRRSPTSSSMTIWGNHSATPVPRPLPRRRRRQAGRRGGRRPGLARDDVHPDRRQARRGDHRGPRRVVGRLGRERRDRPRLHLGPRHPPRVTGRRRRSSPTAPTASRGPDLRRSRCTSADGEWEIVQGLEIDDFSRGRIDASVAELAEERDAVEGLGLI